MKKNNYLIDIVNFQKNGVPMGIYSICSINSFVIEATFKQALKYDSFVLIESTSNQVNQYGGYSGMTPKMFKENIYSIANKTNFPLNKIIIGGDHLGPNPFRNEKSDIAMKKSADMIKEYIASGFSKIHIDTSMHLADDSFKKDEALNPNIVADRCAMLCKLAEETFIEIKNKNTNIAAPFYVIGTEVPVPGGSDEVENGLKVTEVSDFRETMDITKNAFFKIGLQNAWNRVIACVVQPGVEFGDHTVIEYDRKKASSLCSALKAFPNIVFEGHSTDYQSGSALKQMVEDGIAILKVGPALTFAFRESVFLLANIEKELFKNNPSFKISDIASVIEDVMIANKEYWKDYYFGSSFEKAFARKYSYFDRIRYYWVSKKVKIALSLLINNLKTKEIPLTIISQFLPVQYKKIRGGLLNSDPEAIICDRIMQVIDDYSYACGCKAK